MADSQRVLYLICYDISDPKRLGKVHRLLKKRGLPIQYSVFTTVLKRPQVLRLLESISDLIDEKDDDVRCYTLPRTVVTHSIGKQFFPEGVMLFTEGVNKIIG